MAGSTVDINSDIEQENELMQSKEMLNSKDKLEHIEIIGSRRLSGGYTQHAAVPVDLIFIDDVSLRGSGDISDLLNLAVPSFNLATQPNSDEAAFIRPANLRNLPPDNTLVLVNGKRRHRGGVVTMLGSGVSDGSQGPDISAIPAIALMNIQVLRDGASAQYGSDAIAGIINFVLNDAREGGVVDIKLGQSYQGDGDSIQVSTNIGLPLGDEGFLNLSAEWYQQDATARQVQRADAAALQPHNAHVLDPSQTWGKPIIDDSYKLFVNASFPISNTLELYGFANKASKTVDTIFFYRTPNGTDRPSRYSNDGGLTALVGDLNPDNNIDCPVINIVNGNPTTSPGFELIANGGPLDDECLTLSEILPGGFTPTFSAEVDDQSILFGFKGEFEQGLSQDLRYDISFYRGQSAVKFLFFNSLNPSNPNSDPFSVISPGANTQTETNANIDLTYPVNVGLFSDVLLAVGFEWRNEQFKVTAGDPDSYTPGILANQGFRASVDGFAGFSPDVAGTFSRKNVAAYFEAEADVSDNFLLGAAIRWEYFDDFGSTVNFKVSSRWALSDTFALRGSISTGFRAPTPAQSNIIRTATIVSGGKVFEAGIIAPDSPLTVQLSSAIADAPTAIPLGPEKSENISFGAVTSWGKFDLAIDFFHIKIKDRITLSSSVKVDRSAAEVNTAIEALIAAGIAGADSIDSFSFFINDFSTTTEGVDVIASFPFTINGNYTRLALAYNRTMTKLNGKSPAISDIREIQIEQGLPESRLTLSAVHEHESWRYNVRINYYDGITVATDTTATFDGKYGSKILLDADVSYAFTADFSLTLGAQNLLDEVPDAHPDPANNAGQIYPEESPFGFSGGFIYLRANYSF